MKKRLLQVVSLLLVALFVFVSVPIHAKATTTESIVTLQVKSDSGMIPLNCIEIEGSWYLDMNTLLELSDCWYQKFAKEPSLRIFRMTDGKKSGRVIYQLSKAEYRVIAGNVYLPASESTIHLGLVFEENNKGELCVSSIRTPADLKNLLFDIFAKKNYYLWEVTDSLDWGVYEFFARTFKTIPAAGGSLMVISKEQERYDEAIAQILQPSESISSELIDLFSDGNSLLKSMCKYYSRGTSVMKQIWEWIEENPKISKMLFEEGYYDTVKNMLDTEVHWYDDDLIQFLDAYPKVTNAMQFDYFLRVAMNAGAIADCEESTIIAMHNILENSSNRYIHKTADKYYRSLENNGVILGSIYGGYIWNFAFDSLTDLVKDGFEPSTFLKNKIGAEIIIKAIEGASGVNPGKAANATIYYSIYSNIARDIYDYYFAHRANDAEHTACDLRAAGILYLNTILASVDVVCIDEETKKSSAFIRDIIAKDMVALLDFAENEYAPKYDNADLLNKLRSDEKDDEVPSIFSLLNKYFLFDVESAAVYYESVEDDFFEKRGYHGLITTYHFSTGEIDKKQKGALSTTITHSETNHYCCDNIVCMEFLTNEDAKDYVSNTLNSTQIFSTIAEDMNYSISIWHNYYFPRWHDFGAVARNGRKVFTLTGLVANDDDVPGWLYELLWHFVENEYDILGGSSGSSTTITWEKFCSVLDEYFVVAKNEDEAEEFYDKVETLGTDMERYLSDRGKVAFVELDEIPDPYYEEYYQTEAYPVVENEYSCESFGKSAGGVHLGEIWYDRFHNRNDAENAFFDCVDDFGQAGQEVAGFYEGDDYSMALVYEAEWDDFCALVRVGDTIVAISGEFDEAEVIPDWLFEFMRSFLPES